MTLRVAVVQFAPKLGQVQANIAKARELCQRITPRSVDIVCLPEMIFTGYIFPDSASISQHLEHPILGPTSRFCAELARKLHCYVAAGYPERLGPHETDPATNNHNPSPQIMTGADGSASQTRFGANSAVMYGPTGERLVNYRKSNLFKNDIPWAIPGTGFSTLLLPSPMGRTTLAICNDLNVQSPATWESLESGPYELAQHCKSEGTQILVLLNAWLHPDGSGDPDSDEEQESVSSRKDSPGDIGDDLDPEWKTLNYWAMRLRPLWAKEEHHVEDGSESSPNNNPSPEHTFVIICNRFGDELGRTFAGSSALLSLHRGSGRPRLLHAMGQREEGVGIWTVGIPSLVVNSS
ncbi:carbon-nitrogen hydrolase [Hygrophoropsis aurantiaca]|uniref:Carbon-nitrogen hydrolase n=1 Tax=Hygrophoropsis aurantiaca TaxID=72124 RepID=A0ACB8A845_9AGAM|nr:carbon-nitrogen hydrolase [Hygrophoropsis aurantiaca]